MNYLEKAKLFGHDLDTLKRGETITSMVTINNLEEFKAIFAGGITQSQRESVSNVQRKMTGQSSFSPQMTNLMNHVYGNNELTEADHAFAKQVFPVTINVTSADVFVIDTDIQIGPNAAPYAINTDTLVFKGGSITATTTPLTISANNLVIQQGGQMRYHVGIFGATGADGVPGTAGAGYPSRAQDGSAARAPVPGVCTGASDGGDGTDGSTGSAGNAPNAPGNDGIPNLPANIIINAYDPSNTIPFVVFTQSGAGGQGGPGGNGGPGQDGGYGGSGCDSGCEGTDGGNGGKGGDGGVGGNGGNGGNGVSGVGITISFPNADRSMLQTISNPAPFGQGGAGGIGGAAGNPGQGGSGGKHRSDGAQGSSGQAGASGNPGAPGTMTGAPGNFSINYTT